MLYEIRIDLQSLLFSFLNPTSKQGKTMGENSSNKWTLEF